MKVNGSGCKWMEVDDSRWKWMKVEVYGSEWMWMEVDELTCISIYLCICRVRLSWARSPGWVAVARSPAPPSGQTSQNNTPCLMLPQSGLFQSQRQRQNDKNQRQTQTQIQIQRQENSNRRARRLKTTLGVCCCLNRAFSGPHWNSPVFVFVFVFDFDFDFVFLSLCLCLWLCMCIV